MPDLRSRIVIFLPASISIQIVPLRGPMMVTSTGSPFIRRFHTASNMAAVMREIGYRYPYETAKKVGREAAWLNAPHCALEAPPNAQRPVFGRSKHGPMARDVGL